MTGPLPVRDADVARVARALGGAPTGAYCTPVVYPWSVQNFEARPCAPRPTPPREDLRLYVHLPFCRYHCTFCFYAVRGGAKRAEMERYVEALPRELAAVEPGTQLSKLIVGGGTPTALPPALLSRVFDAIFARMQLQPGRVAKMEASPDSLERAHLHLLRERGIGWVSVGIESMQDSVLGTVHRRHSPAQALAACRLVVDHGLRLNADLIYGLPGQSEDDFRRDLEAVAEAGVHSVCLYALRLNDKTRVAKQLDEAERLDLARLMRWRACVAHAAAELGFTQTRAYTWKRLDRLALLDGADGRDRAKAPLRPPRERSEFAAGMSARSQLAGSVYRNHERFGEYLRRVEAGRSPVESVFDLDPRDRKTQFVAGTLGNAKPLPRERYERAFGAPIEHDFDALLARLAEAGLVEDDGARISLSETGRLVYDRVLLCFYPERARGWLAARPAPAARPVAAALPA